MGRSEQPGSEQWWPQQQQRKRLPAIITGITWMVAAVLIPYLASAQERPSRIVTLSGAITETVDALGFGKQIVAVDVTSQWPEYVQDLPRVSRNRSISAEGVAAFRPDLVIAPEGHVPSGIIRQWTALGIRVETIHQEYSVKGALDLIRKIAAMLGVDEKGKALAKLTEERIGTALAAVRTDQGAKPRVLFIYARGAGMMSVAGKSSSLDAIISLAGGRNAVQAFSHFKPYSTEALVKANPDVILMFDFGLSSLGGKDILLHMPGVAVTSAGMNGRIIAMDGPLLVNFSVRLPEAIRELNRRLQRE